MILLTIGAGEVDIYKKKHESQPISHTITKVSSTRTLGFKMKGKTIKLPDKSVYSQCWEKEGFL